MNKKDYRKQNLKYVNKLKINGKTCTKIKIFSTHRDKKYLSLKKLTKW